MAGKIADRPMLTAGGQLLSLLLLSDLVFLGIHVSHVYAGYPEESQYSIESDRGFAEVFQYLKEFWIVTLLLSLAYRWRSYLTFSWMLLFCYLLLDDGISLHEHAGLAISESLSFAPRWGLRAQDFGELLVSGIAGVLLLTQIGIAHYYSREKTRALSRQLAIGLALLVFFGIGVDMVHAIVKLPNWNAPLGMLEDGGEMLVMSGIVWIAFRASNDVQPASATTAIQPSSPTHEVNRWDQAARLTVESYEHVEQFSEINN
jgi:hypothetical protein